MHNSNLEMIVQYDEVISNHIKNWPDRAQALLMQQYLRAANKEAFVAALIGQLCVRSARSATRTSQDAEQQP
ncbi:hypothetical protein [Chromobacterium subtsugae]|uniref:hypothetical protein n=1 Tax=Chromobacterium subtsugae TaxID=251747 RepID=UPI0007F8EA34|nr:hypothetical protein [Chromobacterium subtsugae]OBU85850.1 hypothetical protein MY55_13530 [Chromobacterium subtsugae]